MQCCIFILKVSVHQLKTASQNHMLKCQALKYLTILRFPFSPLLLFLWTGCSFSHQEEGSSSWESATTEQTQDPHSSNSPRILSNKSSVFSKLEPHSSTRGECLILAQDGGPSSSEWHQSRRALACSGFDFLALLKDCWSLSSPHIIAPSALPPRHELYS